MAWMWTRNPRMAVLSLMGSQHGGWRQRPAKPMSIQRRHPKRFVVISSTEQCMQNTKDSHLPLATVPEHPGKQMMDTGKLRTSRQIGHFSVSTRSSVFRGVAARMPREPREARSKLTPSITPSRDEPTDWIVACGIIGIELRCELPRMWV